MTPHCWTTNTQDQHFCSKCGVAPYEPGAGLDCPVQECFDRLYIITRADLPFGMKVAQSAHAALKAGWRLQFHWEDQDTNPATIVVLEAPGPLELASIKGMVEALGVRTVDFDDSDLNIGITSIAFLGSEKTNPITKHLPLVGSEL